MPPGHRVIQNNRTGSTQKSISKNITKNIQIDHI